ncbi:MAG: DegV family protein [Candidatus Heimdallarchaeota archaeon]|nr:DegV family protein [Candidatus Heimdallarchaeota archaeon]
MKIKIITDSTCNLSPEQVKKYDIEVIPCYTVIDGNDILDDGSIPQSEFYDMIDNSKKSQTSLPTPSSIWKAIEKHQDYDHLIMIHVGEKLSGTINAIRSVIKQFKRKNPECPGITVYDSNGVSLVAGYLVMIAKQLVDQGVEVDLIIKELDENRDNDIKVFLTVSDLKKLFEGGRIGRATYMLGDLLHAYPVLSLVDGTLVPVGREIGFERTIGKIIRLIQEFYNEGDEIHISFAQTRPNERNEHFRNKIVHMEKLRITKIEDFLIGNIIACHTGTQVFGLVIARNFRDD